jgi:hypothetical protein
MKQSTIVLIWNAAMAAEVWIAFSPSLGSGPRAAGAEPPPRRAVTWLVHATFAVGMLAPLLERFGYCDAWPAHALYASHVERTEVFLHEDELEAYPIEVRQNTWPSGRGPWLRLDLTGWSRAVRGVPVYPESRACNGLAEALAARYGERRSVRVVQWGPADWWTARRTQHAAIGLEEIRDQGKRYLVNAHPARPAFRSKGP